MIPTSWLKQSIITVLCVLGIPSYLSAPKPISVSLEGQSSITIPANRAILSLLIYSEGPKQDKVADQVRKTTDEILSLLHPLQQPSTDPNGTSTCSEPPPLANLSVNTFRSYSYQKARLIGQSPVYDASVTVSAKFRDFVALGVFLAHVSKTPHIAVQSLKWTLDEHTKKYLVVKCREEAMIDALDKVRAYVRPLGMDKVRAIKIREGYRKSRDVVMADLNGLVGAGEAAGVHDELGGAEEQERPEAFGLVPGTLKIEAEIEGDFCAWKTGLEAWFRRGGV